MNGYAHSFSKEHPLGRDGLLRRLHGNAEGLKECRRIVLEYHTTDGEHLTPPVTFAEKCRAQTRECILIHFIERDLELCHHYGVAKPLTVASLLVDTKYLEG